MAVMIWNGLLILQYWFLVGMKWLMLGAVFAAVIGVCGGMVFSAIFRDTNKAAAKQTKPKG
jgi:hypothetical protein